LEERSWRRGIGGEEVTYGASAGAATGTFHFNHVVVRRGDVEDVVSCFDGEGVGVGVLVYEGDVQSKRVGY
jgi:hypothetical protein